MDQELYQLSERIGQLLLLSGRQLTTAESCTGGWLAQCITAVPGSSQWFSSGYVTYSNAAKESVLSVPGHLLDGPGAPGAVSEETVTAMAEGALLRSSADMALATSGIAGPGGGTADKPVGTVWIGWAVRTAEESIHTGARLYRFEGDRESVRRQSVVAALARLPDIVNNS